MGKRSGAVGWILGGVLLLALCAAGGARAITPAQQKAIRTATFEVVESGPGTGNVAARIRGSPEFGDDCYPAQLGNEMFEGTVVVRVRVDATGCADALGIAHSSGSAELDDAALAGAEKMTFVADRVEGKAIATTKDFKVSFKLHART